MRRFETTVTINQRIDYDEPRRHEEFETITKAEVVHLSTYSRLTYYNESDQRISIKWFKNHNDFDILEITQPYGVMTFRVDEPTYTQYQTSQGIFEMQIDTLILKIQVSDKLTQIDLDYMISMPDGPMGDYEFRLQFEH